MTDEPTPPLRSVSEPNRPSDTDRMDNRAKRIHPAVSPEESDAPASADPKATHPNGLQPEPNPNDAEVTAEET